MGRKKTMEGSVFRFDHVIWQTKKFKKKAET